MFSFQNIEHYQQQLLDGHTSIVAAVKYYLEQINEKAHLNAFVKTFADEALERAAILDERRKSGAKIGQLHGVIVSIKDMISYKDHTITAGSKMLEKFTAIYDATVVARLLEAEAIIIGTCNCDEFGMGSTNERSIHGRVKNAIDESKVSGGSSGGSAVAVQAGLCMISLGTDTGGSVRQPADFCGIIGLKPSYGTISRYGLFAYASSFDQIGILAQSVEDVRLTLDTISGPDTYDGTANQSKMEFKKTENASRKFRFLVFNNALNNSALDGEIKSQILSLSQQLQSDGHIVDSINFELLDYIVPTYYVLTTAEASSNLSRYDGIRYGYQTTQQVKNIEDFYKKNRGEGFGKEVKKRIMLGTFVLSSGYQDAYFTKAQRVRKMLISQTNDLFGQYNFILMPTVTATAHKAGEQRDSIKTYLCDIYTVFANLTGIAGISLPLFTHSNGMPFGAQLLSARNNENLLLDISDRLLKDYKMIEK